MKRNLLKSIKAFSLIELMVVVAIIGVLASIGIPQYSKFQAKARQSEAKIALASLFTAEEGFRQEWNTYTFNLTNIGFAVQGARLRYVTGFATSATCTGYATPLAAGAPPEAFTVNDTWSDGSNVNVANATWAVGASRTKPTGTTGSCSGSAFTGVAYGNPAATAANPTATGGDTWTVNQTKLISNTQLFLGTD